MKCEAIGCENEAEHEHHIIPKFIQERMGIIKNDIVNLCKKHHDILHKMIIKFIWDYIPKEMMDSAIFSIESGTEWFIKYFERKK